MRALGDRDRLIVAVSLATLVVLASARVLLLGLDSMGTDQSRYVYTGLALLDGRGYTTEGGDPFLFRSPAYPLYLATAFRAGGEPAADAAAWLLALGGLVLCGVLAYRMGGAIAVGATVVILASVPLLWEQLASVGVDLPQTALLVAAVPMLWSPGLTRWIAGALVLSVAILVKETVAPAAIALPLAWLPVWSRLSWPRWLGLTAAFGVTISQAVSWWWFYIWFMTGRIFPLNSLGSIVYDAADVPVPTSSVGPIVAVALAIVVGIALLRVRGGDPRVRVTVAAIAGAAPAAVVAITAAQPARNALPLVAITAVAAGVLVAHAIGSVFARRPRVGAAALIGLAVVAVGAGQSRVDPPIQDPLPAQIATFLEPQLGAGEAIVSSQRYRAPLGIALFDDGITVRLLPNRPVDLSQPPESYLWLGLRRGTLFGIERVDWTAALTGSGTDYLVVAEPHPLSPSELLPVLSTEIGRRNGLRFVTRIDAPTGTVQIFEVDAFAVAAPPAIRLHARPEALLAWLDSAARAGRPDPAAELLAATPVTVRQAGLGRLVAELGDAACFRPIREGVERRVAIEVRDDQPRCLTSDDVRR